MDKPARIHPTLPLPRLFLPPGMSFPSDFIPHEQHLCCLLQGHSDLPFEAFPHPVGRINCSPFPSRTALAADLYYSSAPCGGTICSSVSSQTGSSWRLRPQLGPALFHSHTGPRSHTGALHYCEFPSGRERTAFENPKGGGQSPLLYPGVAALPWDVGSGSCPVSTERCCRHMMLGALRP